MSTETSTSIRSTHQQSWSSRTEYRENMVDVGLGLGENTVAEAPTEVAWQSTVTVAEVEEGEDATQ